MALFYFYAFLLTLTRLFFTIFIFYEFIEYFFAVFIMMPVFKISIGLLQCWIMLELSFRINEYILLSKNIPFDLQRTTKVIKWGRICITIFLCSLTAAAVILMTFENMLLDEEGRKKFIIATDQYTAYCCYVMFVLNLAFTYYLITRL